MTSKPFTYYAEILTISVLSFMCANLWTDSLLKYIKSCCKNYILVEVGIAVLFTLLSVCVLYFIFSKENKVKTHDIDDGNIDDANE